MKRKKIAVAIMAATLFSSNVFSVTSSVKAAEIGNANLVQKSIKNDSTVPQEVRGLDKYITRNSDGTLKLDTNLAIKNGYNTKSVEAIEKHLSGINELVKSGELVTDNSLNINQAKSKVSNRLAASYQGVTRTDYSWWGFDRYLNYSDAKSVVSDLNALAIAGTTGTGVVAALGAGPAGVVADVVTTGYVGLLANRIDKYNYGRGVVVHMSYTLVYTVDPQ